MTPLTYEITAPSNIAFLKYWGKRDTATQWPAEDSLSMTLNQAVTKTKVQFADGPNDQVVASSGHRGHSRAIDHLARLRQYMGYGRPLMVHTENTFPTACGIASSASGFAALTIGALAAWTDSHSLEDLAAAGFHRERVAHLARLGSGSAGRSLWGGYVHWESGDTPENQRLVPLHEASHWPLADLIVVVSSHEKAVSSSVAHEAAWTSPLFQPRLAGIPEKLASMSDAIANRSLSSLGPLIEQEALEMHSVMMTSSPTANYWTQGTGDFLAWLRKKRTEGTMSAWFTIDAGPNIHVICELENAPEICRQITASFPSYTIIEDRVGTGPTLEVSFRQ